MKRLSESTYEKLKQFGDVSSWAIWTSPNRPIHYDESAKVDVSNTGDMSIFNDENLINKLREGVVFVGLNASVHKERADGYVGPWANFHSDDDKRQRDYKLRHALSGTSFEGCYMTDVIKNHPDKDSQAVVKAIKADPKILEENIKTLKRELSYFEDKPILVAMGNDAYRYLQKCLKNDYKIIKILHYSHYIGPQKYRARVLDVLVDAVKG